MSQINAKAFPAPRTVLARAAVIAIVIGSALTVINQPDAVFGEAAFLPTPLALVFLTPFLVVSLSQVLGFRAARRAGATTIPGQMTPDHAGALGSFAQTLVSHNIPKRALLVGLAAGVVSTAVAVSSTLLSGGGLDEVSVPLILQALFLPIVFGALSQTLSFRREWGAMQRAKGVDSLRREREGQSTAWRNLGATLSAVENAMYVDPDDDLRRRVVALEARGAEDEKSAVLAP